MLPEIRTILYATGLGPYARRVFRHAMGLAQKYDAKIVIVYAIEPLPPYAQGLVDLYVPTEGPGSSRDHGRQRILDEIRRRLELFCDKELCVDPQGRDRVSEIRILEGIPPDVILAEEKRVSADLIVMGSHGHTAVGEMFLGATAHRVMQKANAPVLLVRLKEGDREEVE